MNITIISPKDNLIRDYKGLNQDIPKIIQYIDTRLTLIQAIYIEDIQTDSNLTANLTLYLKWDSNDKMPDKHQLTWYDPIIKEIPDINAITLRVLGSTIIKVDIHYFIFHHKTRQTR